MTPSRGRRKPGAGPRKPYRGPGALDILGVDVGGVIVDRVAEGTDTSFFGERPLETPAVPGAVDGLRTLAKRFDGRVYVVSKAGPKFSSLTRAWLGHHDVYARTGVPQDHLFFVRDRKDKAQVCERFGIT